LVPLGIVVESVPSVGPANKLWKAASKGWLARIEATLTGWGTKATLLSFGLSQ
jgi:hypothetical protein